MPIFKKTSQPSMGDARLTPVASKPAEDLIITITYYDQSVETISLKYSLPELEKLFSTAMEQGIAICFSNTQPSFMINPRWIKKVTFKGVS